MRFKELLRRLLFLISVPTCVSCKEKLSFNESVLCQKCNEEYTEQKKRNCSRCAQMLPFCSCSNFYLERHFVKRLIKIYRYARYEECKVGNRLIYSLKQENRSDVFNFIAEELTHALLNSLDLKNKDNYIITHVPRRKEAIRHFGFDHAKALSKRVAKRLNIKHKSILKSNSKHAQKETVGQDRLKNASFDYKVSSEYTLKGKRVILIDDIVTTGASIGACSVLLKGLGAREIIGACVGIAYRDAYKPFIIS